MFLASIISPLLGGWALEYGGSYPWIMGAVYLLAALWVTHKTKTPSLGKKELQIIS
jgi:hypothetical protein